MLDVGHDRILVRDPSMLVSLNFHPSHILDTSPFGKRCTQIHDPRVANTEYNSWLPHTETQGNTMETDINVEALHQKRQMTILHGTPFGEMPESFTDLYRTVCHIDYQNGWIDQRRSKIDPIYKLQIAAIMRGINPSWQYKYRPQHIIYDEICMVLSKRAFLLLNFEVHEVPIKKFDPHQHVLVREIAFGPDSDPGVRGVAIWFQIDEDHVQQCTPQKAKRFRWKRPSKEEASKPSAFDGIDSFPLIRPHDEESYHLVTEMMNHRLAVLRAEHIVNLRERFEALKNLEQGKLALQESFEGWKTYWTEWQWPVNIGRETVTKKTTVPPVDGKYKILPPSLKTQDDDSAEEEQVQTGRFAYPVWKSFVSVDFDSMTTVRRSMRILTETPHFSHRFVTIQKESYHKKTNTTSTHKRLRIFEQLAEGEPICYDRSLPRLEPFSETPDAATIRLQKRCWQALLLPDSELCGTNDWSIVREHFEKSRSKKVLTILQT